MRVVQLAIRVMQLIAAAGLLALLVLLNNIETLAGWVMRITVCFFLMFLARGRRTN